MSFAQISFHVLMAQRLHHVSFPTSLPQMYPCLPILPSGDVCFFTAANVDVTTLVEPSTHDRTEIERLVDLAQDRVIHG